MNAALNGCDFRTGLDVSRDDTFLISASSLFHKEEVVTWNTQLSHDLSQDTKLTLCLYFLQVSSNSDIVTRT